MIGWKGQGQTFNQLVSSLKLNKRGTTSNHNIFKALPAKLYRKEIASVTGVSKGSVISVDEMLRPSGAIKTTDTTTGLCTSLNINPPNNTTEYPSSVVCFKRVSGKDDDAKRLVRSAGNARRYGLASPIASHHQYLVSRRLTVEQSMYNHPTNVVGVYRPNGVLPSDISCNFPIYHNPSNTKFQVQGGVTSSSRLERLKLDTVLKSSARASVKTTSNTIIANPRTVKGRMNLQNRDVKCVL
jgi:hypothetical protein